MTNKQRIFLENYFISSSLSETCEKSNVSYPTGLKWVRTTLYNDIQERQKIISKHNLEDMEKLFSIAKSELMELLKNKKLPKSLKLKAIELTFNYCFKSKEVLQIENGIEILNEIERG